MAIGSKIATSADEIRWPAERTKPPGAETPVFTGSPPIDEVTRRPAVARA